MRAKVIQKKPPEEPGKDYYGEVGDIQMWGKGCIQIRFDDEAEHWFPSRHLRIVKK